MRLSEAIRLGAMMTSAARGTLFTNGGACALGAALRAVGVTKDELGFKFLLERWRWVGSSSNVRCPACEVRGPRTRAHQWTVWFIIMHLNDGHGWTREAIGRWVATVEPAHASGTHGGAGQSENPHVMAEGLSLDVAVSGQARSAYL